MRNFEVDEGIIKFKLVKVSKEYCRQIKDMLEECKKLGIERVLMVCHKNNIASAKSIMNNGGILENEVIVARLRACYEKIIKDSL